MADSQLQVPFAVVEELLAEHRRKEQQHEEIHRSLMAEIDRLREAKRKLEDALLKKTSGDDEDDPMMSVRKLEVLRARTYDLYDHDTYELNPARPNTWGIAKDAFGLAAVEMKFKNYWSNKNLYQRVETSQRPYDDEERVRTYQDILAWARVRSMVYVDSEEGQDAVNSLDESFMLHLEELRYSTQARKRFQVLRHRPDHLPQVRAVLNAIEQENLLAACITRGMGRVQAVS